jgi:enoyl-CoA hydratase/carnithine racemase
VQHDNMSALHAWIEAIREAPQPVIAGVEAVAAGAGCSLALNCDLVVASAEARFAMSYLRIGLTPDGGGTHALARLLPRQLAMEWLLEGGVLTAERLHALGVVNRVVAKGTAAQAAIAWAEKLATGPAAAMGRVKRLLDRASGTTLAQQLDAERDAFLEGLFGPECDEGTAAFLGKRPPVFQRG